jgi:hypothetical protein
MKVWNLKLLCMSDFKIGDIIKREKGKNCFEVIEVMDRNRRSRFGDIKIKNLDTGAVYWDFSYGGGFILWYKELEPKKINDLKFDFKNGF